MSIATTRNPLDMGLSLRDWEDFDPDGYTAAAEECVGGEVADLACDVLAGHPDWWRKQIRQRMKERLDDEVERGAPWVTEWTHRFDD